MQEGMHVVISVRDFKAIVTHADTLRTTVRAHVSFPTKPLQFSYQNFGVYCEFTLMTTGDYRGASSTANANFVSTRSSDKEPSHPPSGQQNLFGSLMPPPSRPAASKPLSSQRPTLKETMRLAPPSEEDPEPDSLFMPRNDDEQTWGPANYEEEESLGWDASIDSANARFHPTVRDRGEATQPSKPAPPPTYASQEGLEPTQRLSQVSPPRSLCVCVCVC
jgi:cell cycle checkpoint control protein RAD9A